MCIIPTVKALLLQYCVLYVASETKYRDASGYGGGIVTAVLDMGESNQIDIMVGGEVNPTKYI
jgi:hypothetical protein